MRYYCITCPAHYLFSSPLFVFLVVLFLPWKPAIQPRLVPFPEQKQSSLSHLLLEPLSVVFSSYSRLRQHQPQAQTQRRRSRWLNRLTRAAAHNSQVTSLPPTFCLQLATKRNKPKQIHPGASIWKSEVSFSIVFSYNRFSFCVASSDLLTVLWISVLLRISPSHVLPAPDSTQRSNTHTDLLGILCQMLLKKLNLF